MGPPSFLSSLTAQLRSDGFSQTNSLQELEESRRRSRGTVNIKAVARNLRESYADELDNASTSDLPTAPGQNEDPQTELLQAKFHQARLHAEHQQWYSVLPICVEMLQIHPGNIELLELQIFANCSLQKWEEALKTCVQVLKLVPDYPYACFVRDLCQVKLQEQASSYFAEQKWDEAFRDYCLLADNFPADAETLQRLALCYRVYSNWEGMILCFIKKCEANLTFQRDELEFALQACLHLITANPRNPSIYQIAFQVATLLQQ